MKKKGRDSGAANFPATTPPVLLVDDEETILRSCRFALTYAGIDNIVTLSDSRKVLPLLAEREFSVVLLDLSMPDVSGEKILAVMAQEYPGIPVIVLTGFNDVEMAVKCIKKGALDYLVKPMEPTKFVSTVKNALELQALKRENLLLRDGFASAGLKHPEAFSAILTGNPAMQALFKYTEMVSQTDRPVLISGESGVGKELIAQTLHQLSGRAGRLVPVNVAGLDDTLFADTLFGHEKGAFTGANERRHGLVERAERGTLFLDEIGDLEPGSQIRLLRFLQEGEYTPLGSDVPKHANVRVIAATNRDLSDAQSKGTFRKDLYYRIATHRIHVPPLRERLEDLPLLVKKFAAEAAKALGKEEPFIPNELITLLSVYHFPGNIRELQAMIIDGVAQQRGKNLTTRTFLSIVGEKRSQAGAAAPAEYGEELPTRQEGPGYFPTLKDQEKVLIEAAMLRAGGNQTLAANLLGITRQTLNRHLRSPNR